MHSAGDRIACVIDRGALLGRPAAEVIVIGPFITSPGTRLIYMDSQPFSLT